MYINKYTTRNIFKVLKKFISMYLQIFIYLCITKMFKSIFFTSSIAHKLRLKHLQNTLLPVFRTNLLLTEIISIIKKFKVFTIIFNFISVNFIQKQSKSSVATLRECGRCTNFNFLHIFRKTSEGLNEAISRECKLVNSEFRSLKKLHM